MWRTDSFEKTLILVMVGREGDDIGWDGWMASSTQWTWVWVNSWSWWWTGRPGMQQSMGSQRVGHNWATELNWIFTTNKKVWAIITNILFWSKPNPCLHLYSSLISCDQLRGEWGELEVSREKKVQLFPRGISPQNRYFCHSERGWKWCSWKCPWLGEQGVVLLGTSEWFI